MGVERKRKEEGEGVIVRPVVIFISKNDLCS